jgi:predicted ATPase with chaperone activity
MIIDFQAILHRGKQYLEDFSEVKGQEHVKPAPEIAAAARRSFLMPES